MANHPRRGTGTRREAAVRGADAARHVAASWPQYVERRVELDRLVDELKIDVRRRSIRDAALWHGPVPPAQTRLFGEEAREAISLRSDVEGERRRFALAHELGHAILNRGQEGGAADLPLDYQESFAESFASELLLAGVDAATRAEFRSATQPAQLLALARSIGAPPRVVLIGASRNRWLAGTDMIWLDIATRVNEHTRLERRPRVDNAVLDRSRWFLPRNRSIRGLFGDDRWLASGFKQCSTRCPMEISRRSGEPVRYIRTSVDVEVNAFRLRPPDGGTGVEILAVVEIGPMTESVGG